MRLAALTADATPVAWHRPWPRFVVTEAVWRAASEQLASGGLTLFGFWGDVACVHLALLDELARDIAIFSLDCPDGRFPSVGALHPRRRLRPWHARSECMGAMVPIAPWV